jgi:hypothetical protein
VRSGKTTKDDDDDDDNDNNGDDKNGDDGRYLALYLSHKQIGFKLKDVKKSTL